MSSISTFSATSSLDSIRYELFTSTVHYLSTESIAVGMTVSTSKTVAEEFQSTESMESSDAVKLASSVVVVDSLNIVSVVSDRVDLDYSTTLTHSSSMVMPFTTKYQSDVVTESSFKISEESALLNPSETLTFFLLESSKTHLRSMSDTSIDSSYPTFSSSSSSVFASVTLPNGIDSIENTKSMDTNSATSVISTPLNSIITGSESRSDGSESTIQIDSTVSSFVNQMPSASFDTVSAFESVFTSTSSNSDLSLLSDGMTTSMGDIPTKTNTYITMSSKDLISSAFSSVEVPLMSSIILSSQAIPIHSDVISLSSSETFPFHSFYESSIKLSEIPTSSIKTRHSNVQPNIHGLYQY